MAINGNQWAIIGNHRQSKQSGQSKILLFPPCVNDTGYVSKMREGILTVTVVLINIAIQPDQENILDHLQIISIMPFCTFSIIVRF